MKQTLTNYYHNSKYWYYLLYVPKRIRDSIITIRNNNLNDEELIKLKYKESLNQELDLFEPKFFTEKIQWLKLHDRRDLYTQCADKYLVRDYVKEKIGDEYLIPLELVTENYQDITKEKLPNYPVVIKTTHDSGGTFLIHDKKNMNIKVIHKEIKKRLNENFYLIHREWEYKNIKPKIIVERLLKDESGNKQLNDYKIYCFHGEPMFIQTIFDRGKETKEDWYDVKWNLLDVYYFSPRKKYLKKPELLEKMLLIAKKLSNNFPFVRVDLYIVNKQIYFGELTFRPYGGYMKFVPKSFDKKLGKYLILDNIMNQGIKNENTNI